MTARLLLLTLFTLAVEPTAASAQSDDQRRRIAEAVPSAAPAAPQQARRVLVFTKTAGYRHSSIPCGVEALRLMGERTGAYTIEHSEDPACFATDRLAAFDAVCFLNTTGTLFTDPALRASLLAFVREGKGVVGIHAATDAFYDWREYADMMGGWFHGHPWHEEVTLRIESPGHPCNACFEGADRYEIVDEIYQFQEEPYSRDVLRVLTSLDTELTDMDKGGIHRRDDDFAVSWVRRFGKGRVFYCSLGHREEIYWNPTVLRHYLAGLQFACGDLEADTTPSAETLLEESLLRLAAMPWGGMPVERRRIERLVESVEASGDASRRRDYELAFLGILENPSASGAARDFLLRRLETVASARSLPVLRMLLRQPRLATRAQRVLERIGSEEAAGVLRDALSEVEAELVPGLAAGVARMGGASATPALARLLERPQESVRIAAIEALGALGTAEALDVLEARRDDRDAVAHAQLACAARLGDRIPARARGVWRRWLNERAAPRSVRTACLAALCEAVPEEAVSLLRPWLSSTDPRLQAAACSQVRRLPFRVDLSELIERLDAYPTTTRASLLLVFAERAEEAAMPALIEASQAEDALLRHAGLSGLAQFGGPEPGALLLAVAADRDDELAAVATRALERAARVDPPLWSALDSPDAPTRAVAVHLLNRRRHPDLSQRLIALLNDDAASVRVEALHAVRDQGTGAELLPVLRHLREGDAAEVDAAVGALRATWTRSGDASLAEEELLRSLRQLPSGRRARILPTLAQLDPAPGLALVLESTRSDDHRLVDAAVRTLVQWPRGDARAALLQIAVQAERAEHRADAAAAWVAATRREVPDENARAVELAEALRRGASLESRRPILDGLAELRSATAAQALAGVLEDPDLGAEASAAMRSLAIAVADADPGLASWCAQRLLSSGAGEDSRGAAEALLRSLERWAGFVPRWKLSGPYLEPGVQAAALIERSFAPETHPHRAAWTTAATRADAGRSIDLQQVLGGDERVAYLEAQLYVPRRTEARLEIGSDDGVRVWLNQQIVHSNPALRGYQPAQDRVDVTLAPGWNTLLLKVVNGGGGWAAGCRVLDREGRPLERLEFRLRE